MSIHDGKLPECVRKLYLRNKRPILEGDEPDTVQYRVNGWGANHLEFPLDKEPIVRAVQVQRLVELDEFIGHVFHQGHYVGERDLKSAFRKLMSVAPGG